MSGNNPADRPMTPERVAPSAATSTLDLAPPKPWRRFVPLWLRSIIWVDSVQQYDAFLSYSWKSDSKVAAAIQSAIQQFNCPRYKFRAKIVFRDLSCLPAGSSLETELFDRLDRSAHLIVLASPEAAASRGMEVEARHWFSRARDGEILIIISSGDFIRWEEIRDHLLPPAIANNLTAEPLWIPLQHRREEILSNPSDHQLREELFEDLKQILLRFYPGRDWGQLRGEEHLRRRHFLEFVLGLATVFFMLMVSAIGLWLYAREQRARAEVERDKALTQLLAIQARRTDAEATVPDQIALAGALALESIQLARKSNWPAEADAIETARSALIRLPLVVLSQGSGNSVRSMAVLSDGRLASGGKDGTIKIWPKNGAGEPTTLSQGSFNSVYSMVVLSDGRLASSGDAGIIKIWPKDSASEPTTLSQGGPVIPTAVLSMSVLSDGRLASGGQDGTIKIWSKDGAGEPTRLSQGKGKGSMVVSMAVLADGRLASGDNGGTIKIWPKDGAGEPTTLSQGSAVNSMTVLSDGRLASGDDGGTIKVWSKDAAGEPTKLSQGSSVGRMAALSDGRLASGDNRTIEIWSKDAAGEPTKLSQGSSVWSMAVLSDGRLASGGYDGTIKIWPKDGAGEPTTLSQGSSIYSSVTSMVVLSDGRLASSDDGGTIKIWPRDGAGEPTTLSQGTKQPLAVYDHRPLYSSVTSMVVLSDGRLASGDEDGSIKIWPKNGAGEPTTLSHGSSIDSWVTSMVVLSDGRLASGGDDGTIKIWRKDGAGEPTTLSQGSSVASMAVLSDGRLASGGDDGTIKIWLVDEQKLIAALCLRVGSNLTKKEWARYIGSDIPWQPSCRGFPSNWRTLD
jgi:WD40 repeat protein